MGLPYFLGGQWGCFAPCLTESGEYLRMDMSCKEGEMRVAGAKQAVLGQAGETRAGCIPWLLPRRRRFLSRGGAERRRLSIGFPRSRSAQQLAAPRR